MRASLIRLSALGAVVCLIALAGCLFVPVGYPTWSRTPEVAVNAPADQVVAVLVRRRSDATNITVPNEKKEEIISLLNPDRLCRLEARNEMTWDCAVAGFIFVMPILFASSSTVELRLYRPGYETVIVPSWAKVEQIVWRPAPDVPGQMQALERMNVKESELPRDQQQLYCLFLSREFERLAGAAAALPDDGKLRDVLTANAQGMVTKAKGLENEQPKPAEKKEEVQQAGRVEEKK